MASDQTQFLDQREVAPAVSSAGDLYHRTSKVGNASRMTLQTEGCSSSTEGGQSFTATWINMECSR